MHWSSCAFAWFVLGVSTAQPPTWIVDAANGPGTHFTELQAALGSAQVNDGDQLIVRAGSYAPCTTNKGVTILGQTGARITSLVAGVTMFAVPSLASGRTLVLAGLTIEHDATNALGLAVRNAQGRVHLDGVTVLGVQRLSWPPYPNDSVLIDTCSLVTLNRCDVTGGGLSSYQSDVILSASRVTGYAGSLYPRLARQASEPAILVQGGTLWLSQVTALGGDGASLTPISIPPSPAISGTATLVTLAGDARSSLAAGGMDPTPASAIVMGAGQLRLAPSVVLSPNGNAPPISGGATVTLMPLAHLQATGAPPQGTLALEVTSARGDGVILAASLPGPAALSPFGPVYFDFAAMLTLAIGTQGANGRMPLAVTVPNLPELRGLLLVSQAANVAAASGSLSLTNPVFFPLH